MTTAEVAMRLDLARPGTFNGAGSGSARRERVTRHALERVEALFQDSCRGTVGGRRDGVALASVGSLARGDSGPLSDLDLVLLYDARTVRRAVVDALAQQVWYPLWDDGVRLDHAVRTPQQSRKVATEDLSAAVGMLDIAHVAGDEVLVAEVRQTVAHDWRSHARTRLPELLEQVAVRHTRHGALTSTLEPDLKEGRGGLRDMSIVRALAAAWLADRPHGDVDEAYARLLDVRDAVHVVTGRGRERLLREDQEAVADLLGLPDADALLTEVARSARAIAYALDNTSRRAGQARAARSLRLRPRRPVMEALGHGTYAHDGEVVLGSRVPTGDPLLLLRAAAAAAARRLPLAAVTVRNLTRDLPALPDPWPDSLRRAFVDLLASGPGLVQVWEALDLAGAITHFIPEWEAVSSRPQRSPVHRHTVDRHLVETVVEAAARRGGVDRPDLLLVAALLHDIGKVAGAIDHAGEGAPVAARIARRMGFDAAAVSTVEVLVREHLTLVDLATRRDPADPQTARTLAQALGEQPELVDQLRVLTEADAVAAGPSAWTPWRTSLVDELTRRTRTALSDRREPPREPRGALVLSPAASDALVKGEPLVTVTHTVDGARIDVVDRDRTGLFADTAGLLAVHGLRVRAARVRTTERAAVNAWQVESPSGELPDAADLSRALRRLAAGDRAPLAALDRAPGRPSIDPARSEVTIEVDDSTDVLVCDVRTDDRPALLHDLGAVFADMGLPVRSAHIVTRAAQTRDTFYVLRRDAATAGQVRAALLRVVRRGASGAAG